MRRAVPIILQEDVRDELMQLARARRQPARAVLRANIVLQAAAGKQDKEIAGSLGIGRRNVARWRRRFLDVGIEGIKKDAARAGRHRSISDGKIAEIITLTTQEKPDQATHWSCRSMASRSAVSEATVRRIWKAHGLKPHLVRTFKLSNDPHFAEKLEDIVGLYVAPPEHAIVLSVDEKSQIQALDRSQPSLPLKKGRCGTMTHDYKRNGTTTLFAALNTLDGTLITTCMDKHRHQEWLKFLRIIDKETPPKKQLHLIVDNYATHKHEKVVQWLKKHPRFHIHYTPTSSSWLNMVERFFRDLTQKRIRRGVFRSVPELITAIDDYIATHNSQPKAFIWTAKASDILEKVKRARAVLNKVPSV